MQAVTPVEVRDPLAAAHHPLETRLGRRFAGMVRDTRDLPFVTLIFSALAVLVPLTVAMYLWPSPWLAVAYLAVLFVGFFDRYTLMLHCTSHRRLFVRRLDALNQLVPIVLAPFMGQTPYTYFAHHMGMHHPENNLPSDLSSTMAYRRDSLRGFLRYFATFFFAGIFQLTRYHYVRRHWKMFRMALLGEAGWYLFVVALGFVSLPATLVVFVVPFVLCRFLMMAGNWTQHAFVDLADPGNPYRNSLTTINSRYNRRCFNDGYHIGHHVKANRHWTEMPDDFLANLATYRDQGAVVIDGLDYFQIWALLMLKRYKTLAAHYVELGPTRRSEAEIIALLRERTRHTTRDAAASLSGGLSGRTTGHAPL